MKTVLLLRHAKSDWGSPGLADFDRPLAKRGLNDAPRIGEVLAKFNCVPDKILSSPAKRAKQTANLVAKACGYGGRIDWQDAFYGATSNDMLEALQKLPEKVEAALLVGHNPTMEETAAALLGGDRSGWQESYAITMPTAALAMLSLDIIDWAELEPGDGTLRWFLIPKLLKAILK